MKDLLTSRKFWAAIITIIVLIVSSIIPGFDLEADTAAGFVIIMVSYMIGVAVDPGPGGWRGVIQSRKFWGACVGLLILSLDAFHIILPLGLTPEILISIAVAIGGYIAGVAREGPRAMTEHDVQSYG